MLLKQKTNTITEAIITSSTSRNRLCANIIVKPTHFVFLQGRVLRKHSAHAQRLQDQAAVSRNQELCRDPLDNSIQ